MKKAGKNFILFQIRIKFIMENFLFFIENYMIFFCSENQRGNIYSFSIFYKTFAGFCKINKKLRINRP